MRRSRLVCLAVAAVLCSAAARSGAQDLYRGQAVWLDEQSRPFMLESLRGHATVLTMAYGACRRVCSTSLRIMENLQTLADQRGLALDFVVVGLDPQQDTPEDWADFRALRKLTRANWHFLSGDEAATRSLADHLGVNYWRYGEHVMHDFRIVLLSPDGRLSSHMDRFDEPLSRLLP